MRLLTLLVLVVALPLSYAETLTIGIPPYSPPFVMTADDKGHIIGFSIDIMSAICKRLKVTCQYKLLGFDETFKEVINQKIDLGVGNFTITPERKLYVSFSLPYLESDAAIVALSGSPITSIEDLKGKTIGAERDSIFKDYIENRYANTIAVIDYPIITEEMFALSNGDIDGVILDKQTAQFWVGNNNAMFKIIDSSIPIGLGLGIIVNKDNTTLLTRVNQTLVTMQSDGAYLKIYNTYFGDMKRVMSPLF